MTLHRKVTEFVGISSGDGECFCFETDDADLYPEDLMPEGIRHSPRGKWRVTVEFEDLQTGSKE